LPKDGNTIGMGVQQRQGPERNQGPRWARDGRQPPGRAGGDL